MTDTVVARDVRHYEAPGVSGAPRLAGLPGVDRVDGPGEQTLESFCHDTEDLRLARAGVSVQRELDHPGWHWMLRREGEPPLEVPADDGSDAVPAAVLELVTTHTRGRELVAVAHTQRTRSVWQLLDWEGGHLGEITGDAVSAQTLGATTTVDSWYEVRIDIAGPNATGRLLPALEERLVDIGATPATPAPVIARLLPVAPTRSPREPAPVGKKSRAGKVVLSAITAQVARFEKHDPLVRRDEPDAVHQMRVATRQLRSMLRTFGAVVDRDATRRLTDELKWLAGALGAARDQEVIQERVEALVAATPPENVLGPITAQLTQQFAREQTEAHAHVVAELDTDRYFALRDALDVLLAAPPITPLARKRASTALPPLVRKTVRKVDKAVDVAHRLPMGTERAEALHTVRKTAKRVRYAAELATPVVGKKAARTGKRFKAVQTVLGDHQDAVQTRAFLRALGARGHLAGQNGFTAGIWYEQEAAAAADVDAAFEDTWRRAAARKHRKWLS